MITPSQIPNPYVKPRWQAPVGVMESVVAYNCRKYGMPRPVLAMPMWEGAGNRAIDLSGYGHHTDNFVSDPEWLGNGIYFDGTAYADGRCHIINNKPFSIIIDTTPGSITGWQCLFECGSGAAHRYGVWSDSAKITPVSDGYNSSTSNYLVAGQRTKLGLVHRYGVDNRIYVDGEYKESTANLSGPTVTTSSLQRIASESTGTSYKYTGTIYTILVFDCILSDAQMKFLYDNPYFMYRLPEELYGYVAAAVGDTVTYTSDALFKKLGLAETYSADLIVCKGENSQISLGTDDCFERDGTTALLVDDILYAGRTTYIYDTGLRWQSINIPPGASITSAKLSLYLTADTGTLEANIRGIDEDNTVTWATDDRPSQRTKTSATITANEANWGNWGVGNWIDIDITSVIQEIADRGGWSANNALAIVIENAAGSATNYVGVRAYEYSGNAHGAKLDIVYTTGATTSYTADALLQKLGLTKTYSADSLLKVQNLLKSYTSDILIKLTDGDITYSADALLELDGITKTYSSDLLIAVRQTKAYTTDALLKALGVSTSYTTDALLKLIDESKTYTADSLIKKVDAGIPYTSDALLKKEDVSASYTTDVLIQDIDKILSYTADTIIQLVASKTYTADALLKKLNNVSSYTADLIISSAGIVSYSADTLLKLKNITKAYTADLLIMVTNTLAYTADALIKKTGVSTSYSSDALIKELGLTTSYTSDSLLQKTDISKTYSSDMLIALRQSKAYTADALLKILGSSTTYSSDTLIKTIDEILSYTADSLFKITDTKTYTSDTLLKKLNAVNSYTADLIINAAGVLQYSADLLIKVNDVTKAYTADLLIMAINTSSYTSDALIKKLAAIVGYSADALLKKQNITTAYTSDALLQKAFTTSYTSDALLQKAFTSAYTTDALLKKEGATALYTADALLKKAVSLSYSADVIISALAIGSRTYTADLLIDIVSAEYPARVFFIRKSGTPQTGLTPAIDCYNKVVDGASGGTSPMVREIGCGHYKFHYDISEDIAVRVDTGDVTMTDEERYLDVGTISQYDDAIDRKLSDVESNIRGSDGDDLKTISDQIDLVPTSAVIASDVWDEILTGATHNIATSAGRRVREIGAFAIHSGTAQAGNSHSITLAASANANDGVYNRNLIVLTDNTGVGQTRTIVDYDGTSKIVVVDRDWRVSPDATTAYQIVPDDTPLTVDHGVARGGTNRTITIRAYASSVDDAYLCNIVTIIAGKGRGQARLVGAYDGTTNVVTICGDDWVDIPDTTSVYVMMPYGVACAACISDNALDQIGDAVWDEDLTGHTTSKSAGWFVQKIKAIADAILAMVT